MKNYTIYYQQMETKFDEKENRLYEKMVEYEHEASREETKRLRFRNSFGWFLVAFICLVFLLLPIFFGGLETIISCSIIFGLMVFLMISGGIVNLYNSDYHLYRSEYDNSKITRYFVDKYFKEEYTDRDLHDIRINDQAKRWRENHPLEEKCRLAMEGNPNYVADLIRYVQEENKKNRNI